MTTKPLKITMVAVAGLKPYEKNARTHSETQIAQIAGSITEFGWTSPILYDAQGIIAGHGRIAAAQLLGMDKVPGIALDGLSPDQRRALILADNKLALNAGWDDELLAAEIRALIDAEINMDLIGFSSTELDRLLADGADTDPDDVPPAPEDPVSQLGDTWVCGNHRITCGDSTDPATVEQALDGADPHLMVTDPPYGVSYDATFREGLVRDDGSKTHARATGKVLNDDRADWREAWALFRGDVAYVWCASLHVHEVAESLIATGFDLRCSIIWAKQQFAIGRGDYHWQHEPCWYAVRKGKTGHWQGSRKETSVWEIDKPQASETGHSTQKPIECMQRPMLNNSERGDAIYEPFSGSGTTLLACEINDRHCRAIELNPAYVDVAVIRWQNHTGKQAVRASDGRPFDEVMSDRKSD